MQKSNFTCTWLQTCYVITDTLRDSHVRNYTHIACIAAVRLCKKVISLVRDYRHVTWLQTYYVIRVYVITHILRALQRWGCAKKSFHLYVITDMLRDLLIRDYAHVAYIAAVRLCKEIILLHAVCKLLPGSKITENWQSQEITEIWHWKIEHQRADNGKGKQTFKGKQYGHNNRKYKRWLHSNPLPPKHWHITQARKREGQRAQQPVPGGHGHTNTHTHTHVWHMSAHGLAAVSTHTCTLCSIVVYMLMPGGGHNTCNFCTIVVYMLMPGGSQNTYLHFLIINYLGICSYQWQPQHTPCTFCSIVVFMLIPSGSHNTPLSPSAQLLSICSNVVFMLIPSGSHYTPLAPSAQ